MLRPDEATIKAPLAKQFNISYIIKTMNATMLSIKRKFESQDAVCHQAMTFLSLLANKARFRILCALTAGDFCVNELVEMVGTAKVSNVSQQLKMLSLAGLIEGSRDKKRIVYRLKDERVREMVGFLEKRFGAN